MVVLVVTEAFVLSGPELLKLESVPCPCLEAEEKGSHHQ